MSSVGYYTSFPSWVRLLYVLGHDLRSVSACRYVPPFAPVPLISVSGGSHPSGPVHQERPRSTDPSASAAGDLRRACSLSDLNRPAVTRRILPAPPTNGVVMTPVLFSSFVNLDRAACLKFYYSLPEACSKLHCLQPIITLPLFHPTVSGKKKQPSSQQQQQQPSQQQQQPPSPSKVKSHAQQHLAMTRRLSKEAVTAASSSPSPVHTNNVNAANASCNSPTSEDVPSYMRPTSSSNKKLDRLTVGLLPSSPGTGQPRRKSSSGGPSHAQSASDISRLKDEDSSSEENVLAKFKQVHHRGRRSSSQDR